MNNFISRLKEERERLGFSQRELAERVGITKQTQFKYEKGQSFPTTEYLKAIRTLGFDLPFLLGLIEEVDSEKVKSEKVKSEIVKLCVRVFKEVEVTTMDENGFTPSLAKRIQIFKSMLESEMDSA